MINKSFEDLEVWKYAKELVVEVYKQTKNIKDWGYADQLQRASISTMNNIAEGFERSSRKEFCQFLVIAKGSAGEVRSMIIVGKELGYISEASYQRLFNKVVSISKMLSVFIKRLRE